MLYRMVAITVATSILLIGLIGCGGGAGADRVTLSIDLDT